MTRREWLWTTIGFGFGVASAARDWWLFAVLVVYALAVLERQRRHDAGHRGWVLFGTYRMVDDEEPT